jgi:hypothetical protein
MNCGPWNAFNLFGTIFSLVSPVLWLPPARFVWTYGPFTGRIRLANIPAGWTLCLPMNNHGIVATLNLESHSTFEHVEHIHRQPDTPRKDQVKPQSIIKQRSNDTIHIKDPLVLVSPRHARTLPFPPPSPAGKQRRFRSITPD